MTKNTLSVAPIRVYVVLSEAFYTFLWRFLGRETCFNSTLLPRHVPRLVHSPERAKLTSKPSRVDYWPYKNGEGTYASFQFFYRSYGICPFMFAPTLGPPSSKISLALIFSTRAATEIQLSRLRAQTHSQDTSLQFSSIERCHG